MQPKNEAMIDLERMLSTRMVRLWNKQYAKHARKISSAVKEEDWVAAHDEVDRISFAPVAKKTMKLARTVGIASLMLGHSRLTKKANNDVSSADEEMALRNALTQFEVLLKEIATEQIRKRGHKSIEKARREDTKKADEVIKADPVTVALGPIGSLGQEFAHLASNLHTSRLNSFGFIAEALEQGFTHYQVDEVMDKRTCPVCREMNGKVFTVQQGAMQAMTMMQNDDPDSMRQLAPWPRQDKASVARLAQMDSNELAAAGLPLPPYHPSCRGIVTSTTSTTLSSGTPIALQGVAPASVSAEAMTVAEAYAVSQNAPLATASMGGDIMLHTLAARQGFTGLPTLVTKQQFNRYDGWGDVTMHRGVTKLGATESATFANQFRRGDYYAGRGVSGNGTYVAYGYDAATDAKAYGGLDGTVMKMKVDPKAKVVSHNDLLDIQSRELKALDELMEAVPNDEGKLRVLLQQEELIMDEGRLAVVLGYDAIDVAVSEYMVILNRTILIMED